MEFIDSIMYRKINPSDFKNMYKIDRPSSGGGQTYIELAGIDEDDLVKFLSLGEKVEKDNENEFRYMYLIDSYTLGRDSSKRKLEFDPRFGRRNYRISRQTVEHRHPAWKIENGFPEPKRDNEGNYTSQDNFEGVIDYLIIFIIRTSYNKYYAGFVNQKHKPEDWPVNINLNEMFQNDRRGIIFFSKEQVEFRNNKDNPFGDVHFVPKRKTGGRNILLYGVPGSGKSHRIQEKFGNNEERMERIVFHADYMNTDFIGQILPTILNDERITYEFTPGPFTRILKKSWKDPENMYYLIIEEINRGNAPAIFGEVFQLLDRDNGESEYSISNQNIALEVYGNENKQVKIPSNLSILATMNTADQNVFTLDTAFQRRWEMKMIENDISAAEHAEVEILDTGITWKQFNTIINNQILKNNSTALSSEDKRLGAYYINKQNLIEDSNNLASSSDQEPFISSFAETVIKYLWDDAFKFSRDQLFHNSYKSLEKVIKDFSSNEGVDRFQIFSPDIFETLNSDDILLESESDLDE